MMWGIFIFRIFFAAGAGLTLMLALAELTSPTIGNAGRFFAYAIVCCFSAFVLILSYLTV